MIVLSAGMPKSGTAWYYNMTNDLLMNAGFQDARVVSQRFRLQTMLQGNNCRLDGLTYSKLARLSIPHWFGNTFAVKTHNRPTDALEKFMRWKIVKATYIYRDPRDVVLSAYDHGEKARNNGKTANEIAFAGMDTLENAAKSTAKWLRNWKSWMNCKQVLFVRYEDLVADTVNELERLSDFLELTIPVEQLQTIAKTYSPENLDSNKGVINFNKGIVGRFKDVMSEEELAICRKYFKNYPQKMGYSGW